MFHLYSSTAEGGKYMTDTVAGADETIEESKRQFHPKKLCYDSITNACFVISSLVEHCEILKFSL